MTQDNVNNQQVQQRPRVLCYAPLHFCGVHGLWEKTVLMGSALRGAEVKYVVCNGIYTICESYPHRDLFGKELVSGCNPNCPGCVERTKVEFGKLPGVEFEWISQYLTQNDLVIARQWAGSLRPDQYATAVYGDWNVGQWVESTVLTRYRLNFADMNIEDVRLSYRAYLYSGLLACIAITRMLDSFAPTVLFMFNGRFSTYRVAYELARRRGIRVVCHERGIKLEHLCLLENGIFASRAPYAAIWDKWKDIPLTTQQMEQTAGYLAQRRHGQKAGWLAFHTASQSAEQIYRKLNIAPNSRVWLLMTSSTDEMLEMLKEAGRDYLAQHRWVESTIEYARNHPDLTLAIRVHPNLAGQKVGGEYVNDPCNVETQYYADLQKNIPPNVRIVMPADDANTYAIMEIADVGLSFITTAGIEMACLGKTVVLAGPAIYSESNFVRKFNSPEEYRQLLDSLLDQANTKYSLDVQRGAFRFVYRLMLHSDIPFPLVKMETPFVLQKWNHSPADLAPGNDAGLDRVCRILMDGESVMPAPSEADRAIGDTDETMWLTEHGRKVGDDNVQDNHAAEKQSAEVTPVVAAIQSSGGQEQFELTTPVAFMIYNRPEPTAKVFEAIRAAKPKTLLLIADGPNPKKPGDAQKCQVTRELVKKVDWNCKVLMNFSEQNMGCGKRVSTGLDWVFQNFPEAIIMEDDCLPDPSFFSYCQEMLKKYRHNRNVVMVSGDNFLAGRKFTEDSYFFSRYAHIWGWATWRRAWRKFDIRMQSWPKLRAEGWAEKTFANKSEAAFWTNIFDNMHAGRIDTWDYAWVYTCFTNGLSVYPSVNMISNIGFGAEATHTKSVSAMANLPVEAMGQIKHAKCVVRNEEADRFTLKHVFQGHPIPPLEKLQPAESNVAVKSTADKVVTAQAIAQPSAAAKAGDEVKELLGQISAFVDQSPTPDAPVVVASPVAQKQNESSPTENAITWMTVEPKQQAESVPLPQPAAQQPALQQSANSPLVKEDLYDVAYRTGWANPQLRQLIWLCYKTPDFADNARRFLKSQEFTEAVHLLSSLGKSPSSDRKVLDLGCGNGVACYALAKAGYSVVGADSSTGELAGINAARKLQGLDGAKFEIQHSTGERLAFADESFDVVWLRETLHHIRDLAGFLTEVKRVLKPGGLVFCMRDHVIWTEQQRADFFATHPFYHITKDEGCYYLQEYLDGFARAGLKMEQVIDPVASVLNTYPFPCKPGAKFDVEQAKQRKGGNDLYSFVARKTTDVKASTPTSVVSAGDCELQAAFDEINVGRCVEGIAMLEKLRRPDRFDSRIEYALAFAMARQGQIVEAIESLATVVERTPEFQPAAMLLVELCRLPAAGDYYCLPSDQPAVPLKKRDALTADCLAQQAGKFSTWKEILEFHSLLPGESTVRLDPFYRQSAGRFGDQWRYWDESNMLYAAASQIKPQSCLAIGVGDGRLLAMLARLCPSVRIVACDDWTGRVGGAEGFYAGLQKNGFAGKMQVVQGDVRQLMPMYLAENSSAKFDLIIADAIKCAGMIDKLLPHLSVGGAIIVGGVCKLGPSNVSRCWISAVERSPQISTFEYLEQGEGVVVGVKRWQ